MERLTEFWKGIYILSEQARKDGYDNYSAYSKLAAYEDTGITPDGIEDIKACLDVNGDGHSGADTLDDLLELMQYRKTGLTPKQIKEIDKLYMEKCQEVNKLKAESLTGLEMAQIYATLNHYKKLEEQGRLIELPCKVGDTVYKVNKASRKVAEHNVIKIEYESNDNKGFCCQIWFENYDFCFVHHFGKTVFLTREEAEKVLDQQKQE